MMVLVVNGAVHLMPRMHLRWLLSRLSYEKIKLCSAASSMHKSKEKNCKFLRMAYSTAAQHLSHCTWFYYVPHYLRNSLCTPKYAKGLGLQGQTRMQRPGCVPRVVGRRWRHQPENAPCTSVPGKVAQLLMIAIRQAMPSSIRRFSPLILAICSIGPSEEESCTL